jgi:hypothetical protein
MPAPGDAPATAVVKQYIPAAIADRCADYPLPHDSPLAEGLIGAVRCQPTGSAAPGDVWYFEYADQAALTAAFAGLTRGGYQAGDCRAAGEEFEYTTDEAAGDRVGGCAAIRPREWPRSPGRTPTSA